MPDLTTTPPLTKLSEEEELFRDTVRDFAEREVRPRVVAMEKASAIDPTVLRQCFDLGLMGIDIPEVYGGGGGSFLMFFFFQAEDGIRDLTMTGVQTCALPISVESVVPAKTFGVQDTGVADTTPGN